MRNRQLDREQVAHLFSLFSDLTGEALEPWLGFCDTAAGWVEARLREDADPVKEMEALCAAAAARVYCDFLLLQGPGSTGSLRVGDISLSEGSVQNRRDALDIRDHFQAGVAHLLRPDCPALIPAGGAE